MFEDGQRPARQSTGARQLGLGVPRSLVGAAETRQIVQGLSGRVRTRALTLRWETIRPTED